MNTPIEGTADILLKIVKSKVIKKVKSIVVIILIVMLVTAVGASALKKVRESNVTTLQQDFFTAAGLEENQEISDLIEIKGNKTTGYYLTFVEDIDERLENVLKDNREIYKNIGITDIDTLKTFIKAQIATEFPNLEGSKGGGLNVPDFNGGIMEIPLYLQADPAWGGSHYLNHPSSTLANNGCGQTSVAMVVSYLTGTEVTPVDVAQWCDNPKFANAYFNGIGSTGLLFAAAAENWDIGAVTETTNTDELIDALASGKPVISYQNKGLFTTRQHFIVLTGVDDDGKIHVNDPASQERSNTVYTLEQVNATNITYYIYEGGSITEDEEDTEGKEEKFQGNVTIRRITPNKNIGEYKELSGELTTIDNEGVTKEGLGTKEDLPEKIRKEIIESSNIPEDAQSMLDNLSYLTIPYVNFEGEIKNGHMIVNKDMADEILRIFQELYNIKYPIEKMEIVDSFAGENREDLEYYAIEENNTFSFYYGSSSAHLTGNAIDLNPQINPLVENGEAGHANASMYVDRDNKESWSEEAKAAYIDKETEVYKIFEKYGWTWGGNNETSPDYKHFEKLISTETTSEEATIDSKVFDLKYVSEEEFNEYVEKNSSYAIKLFTLDEDKNVITATWSYSTEEGTKILEARPINYKMALSKYKMSLSYLLTMAVYSEDVVFCEGLANLAIDSEYIIAIEDKVTTTQTIVDTTEVSKLISDKKGFVRTMDSNSDRQITSSESVSQIVEVTYVDSWFVKYEKDYSYSTEYLKGVKGKYGTINLSGEAGEYIGDFEITAYCSCGKCCGKYSPENGGAGTTASGTIPQEGLTIASNILPQGSYVMFNEHVYHVEDTGSGLEGNWIDLYMDSHQDALNWGIKTFPVYWAEDVGETTTSGSNNRSSVSVSIDAMGEITKSESTTPQTSTSTYQYDIPGYYVKTVKSIVTTTGTYTYEYKTGNGETSGDSQEFVDLYKDDKCINVKNVYVPWLLDSLEQNYETVNMVEITEYLFSQAMKKSFGKNSTLKFSDYAPGDFKDTTSLSSDLLLYYISSWENPSVWKYQHGECTYNSYVARFITEDKTQYKCFTDGDGRRNFSCGICHYYDGHYNNQEIYASEGVDITQYYEIGSLLDVEIVDAVQLKIIESNRDIIESKLQKAGITLKENQLQALDAICYQWGARDTMNDFIIAYQQYGDTEALRHNFVHNGDRPFLTGNDDVDDKNYEIKRANANWKVFHENIYTDSSGNIIDTSQFVGGGTIVEQAVQVHKYVRENNYYYAQLGINLPNFSGRTIDCSSFVTWVLINAKIPGFTEGMHQWCSGDFTSNSLGWKEVSVNEAQPGDIVTYNGHVEIIAGSGDSTHFLVYNCGGNSSIQATGEQYGVPEASMSSHTKSVVRKVLRVPQN